jgi:hypothetical protein
MTEILDIVGLVLDFPLHLSAFAVQNSRVSQPIANANSQQLSHASPHFQIISTPLFATMFSLFSPNKFNLLIL